MGVTGSYLAWRVRTGALTDIRAYCDCVLGDILPGFQNLDQRAEEVSEQEFQRLGAHPGGEDWGGDMADLAEAAQEQGLVFYETMRGLRQATLNLFAAGLFHLVEQELADLCSDPAFRGFEPSDTKLSVLTEWCARNFGIDLTNFGNWITIDELRLVANAVKHAEGSSAMALRTKRPTIFEDPDLPSLGKPTTAAVARRVRLPLAGDGLYVTEAMLREYAARTTGFLEAIAEHFDETDKDIYPRGG